MAAFFGGSGVIRRALRDNQIEKLIGFKKWTLIVLIHFFDLAIVNARRAYRIDCEAKKYPRCKILDLLDFRMEIHEVLINVPEKRQCEEAGDASDGEMPVPRKYAKSARPSVSLRYDGYDHLPIFYDMNSPRACQFETAAAVLRHVAFNAMCTYASHVTKSCFFYHKK
ncbi:uncharacterized protein LOC113240210 [Hyposmocoma kahamanoa]|uniref:uncharacterized protein LOC113240210 n=1 Tax=Hyposmocoma kahamanoa TaxID=1477025 RepID=UPI000E6D6363|nr:uncharacterized protein LOC113240210 [Hyposmocoma kahamanoa]